VFSAMTQSQKPAKNRAHLLSVTLLRSAPIESRSTHLQDDTSPEPSKEEPPKEENKLAALNDLIKNQMFNPSTVDDADDFDTFLIKLNQRRSPPKEDISTVSSKYEESQSKQDYRKRLDEEFSIKLPEPLPIRDTPVKPTEEAPLEHTFNPTKELHEESKDQSQLSIVQSKYEDLMQFLENADQTAAQALSQRSQIAAADLSSVKERSFYANDTSVSTVKEAPSKHDLSSVT
jgi:hypothetical protein